MMNDYINMFENFWNKNLNEKTKVSFSLINIVVNLILCFVVFLIITASFDVKFNYYLCLIPILMAIILEYVYKKQCISSYANCFKRVDESVLSEEEKVLEKENIIKMLFDNQLGSIYLDSLGLLYDKLKNRLMSSVEVETMSHSIIKEIGNEKYKKILNSDNVKKLISDQNGISYYCMFLIVLNIKKSIKENKINDLIGKISQ